MGGHEGAMGKRESPAREAADNPADQKNRVEALAATFRRLNSAKNAESMYFFPDMLVSLAALPGGDFPLLFQIMESDGKLDGESAITPLLHWASLDPRSALAFALSRKEFNSSERVLSAIVYQLARSDLSAAKTALANFPEKSEERRDARRAIVKVLLQKDPKAAIAYAREVADSEAEASALAEWARTAPLAAAAGLNPEDPAHRPALEAIATALVTRDRTAFETWAESLTDPAARLTARRIALHEDALSDPAMTAQAAARWLAAEPAAGAAQGDLPVHIAQRWWWAKAPPQLVADWAISLPAGPARDAAIGEVGRLWVKQDAMEASHWIDKVPASSGRDKVVTQLIQEISSDAPNDAFVWSGTIQDPALRRNMREACISAWAAKDVTAALAALETLPQEQRGTLREKIGEVQEMESKKR